MAAAARAGAATASDAPGDPQREPAAPRSERARRLIYFMLLRVVVTTLFLGASVLSDLTGAGGTASGALSGVLAFALIGITYGLTLLWALLLRRGASPERLAALQIGCDVVVTTLVVHAEANADSGFVLLYLLAVIGGAMTLPGRAAAVTVVAVAATYAAIAIGDRLGWLPPWPAGESLGVGPLRGVLFPLGKNLMFLVATWALSRRLADELQSAGERIAAQGARLQDLATFHADVVRSLTSGLLTVGRDGTVLALNPAGEEILGNTLPVGEPLSDSFPELAQLLDETPPGAARRRGELVVVLRDGERRVLGLSVSPLVDAGGGAIGRVVNFQDLSELRRMQERIERTERLAAIGRLAAGVAHEIRNPLAAISGSVELLRGSQPIDGEGRELMDIVTREADRLNRLITDLLDFARPRTPEKTAVDVGLTLGEILRVVENDRRLNPTANRFHLALPGALHVEADPGQLRQVVLNLLFNAADATPGGEAIDLSASADGEQVRIEVRDRGPGIPTEVRPRIFEPFYTTKKGGTGLGLATVHRIIEEHHGSIEIADPPGGGTSFIVRLPRARVAARQAS